MKRQKQQHLFLMGEGEVGKSDRPTANNDNINSSEKFTTYSK
jgi:hypothetical protein